RSTIDGNALPLALQAMQKLHQVIAKPFHLLPKTRVKSESVRVTLVFITQKLLNRRTIELGQTRRIGTHRDDSQCTAMNFYSFDIDDQQPVTSEQMVERGQREVAQVLMIDGIEL